MRDWYYDLQERAAILEFDGEYSRVAAGILAKKYIIEEIAEFENITLKEAETKLNQLITEGRKNGT